MPCYITDDPKLGRIFMCGDLGPHCVDCAAPADNLCDFPVGDGKTCDRDICEGHSHEIGPNLHYCAAHFSEWSAFREAGGVKRELENVMPFKRAADDGGGR